MRLMFTFAFRLSTFASLILLNSRSERGTVALGVTRVRKVRALQGVMPANGWAASEPLGNQKGVKPTESATENKPPDVDLYVKILVKPSFDL